MVSSESRTTSNWWITMNSLRENNGILLSLEQTRMALHVTKENLPIYIISSGKHLSPVQLGLKRRILKEPMLRWLFLAMTARAIARTENCANEWPRSSSTFLERSKTTRLCEEKGGNQEQTVWKCQTGERTQPAPWWKFEWWCFSKAISGNMCQHVWVPINTIEVGFATIVRWKNASIEAVPNSNFCNTFGWGEATRRPNGVLTVTATVATEHC